MYEIVIVFLLLVSVAIVALILVQQGKGAGMGASFGAGASNTVFGSTGSGNFLTRSTWTLAIVFFGICLLIGYLQKQDNTKTGDFTNIGDAPVTEVAPADVPTIEGDVPAVSADEMKPATESDVPVVEGEADTAAPATDAPVLDAAVEAPVDEELTAEDAQIKEAVEESNNEPADAK